MYTFQLCSDVSCSSLLRSAGTDTSVIPANLPQDTHKHSSFCSRLVFTWALRYVFASIVKVQIPTLPPAGIAQCSLLELASTCSFHILPFESFSFFMKRSDSSSFVAKFLILVFLLTLYNCDSHTLCNFLGCMFIKTNAGSFLFVCGDLSRE